MTTLMTKAALGAALVASATMAAAPAEARDYYRYGHRNHSGDAVVAGIAGLAIGAAIASSSRSRYYDDGYYYPRYRSSYRGGYYYPQTYYYKSYPRGYYYDSRRYRHHRYDRYRDYRDGYGYGYRGW